MISYFLARHRRSVIWAALASISGLASSLASADVLNPVIGDVIYEEQFNDFKTEHWTPTTGNNCGTQAGCGFGNGELQSYQPANLTIEDIPGDLGNKAMVITAKRERAGDEQFTSGKFDSSNKLTVHYGLIEARIRIPRVEGGLWPAFWALGNNRDSWPRKGEIDVLEAGYPAGSHPQYPNFTPNNFVSANLFFYSQGACNAQNASCAANFNWSPPPITASSPQRGGAVVPDLAERFAVYRLYWTPSELRMTVQRDDDIERDMWRRIDTTGSDFDTFRRPYFLIFNMAVGGSLTSTDAVIRTRGSNPEEYARAARNITADFPNAKMYIDYIRVRRLDGYGTVAQGSNAAPGGSLLDPDQPETGVFGVFTDNTPVSRKLTLGSDLNFYVWEGTLQAVTTEPAYEGSNVIALSKSDAGWFGAAFNPTSYVDLSRFNETGSLKFRIKAPADLTFRIGIRDSYTNSNSVEFPANTTRYGLVRDGGWGQVTIPVADLRGPSVAMQSLTALFEITRVANASNRPAQIAIDDIYYDCGTSPACNSSSSAASSSVRSSLQSSSVVSSVPRSSSSVASSVPRSSSSSSVGSLSSSSRAVSSSSSVMSSSSSSSARSVSSSSSVVPSSSSSSARSVSSSSSVVSSSSSSSARSVSSSSSVVSSSSSSSARSVNSSVSVMSSSSTSSVISVISSSSVAASSLGSVSSASSSSQGPGNNEIPSSSSVASSSSVSVSSSSAISSSAASVSSSQVSSSTSSVAVEEVLVEGKKGGGSIDLLWLLALGLMYFGLSFVPREKARK